MNDHTTENGVSDGYLKALPLRMRIKYSKKDKRGAIFHAIVDLWRIYNDREINDDITDFVNAIVQMEDFGEVNCIAYCALNDLLAANLLLQTISPSTARQIRQIILKQHDLHGVMRADLYNPLNGTTHNPVFDMVGIGGIYPGIFQYLRFQRSVMEQKKFPNIKGWDERCYVPASLVTSVLLETYRGFITAHEFIYTEACLYNDASLFAMLSLADSRKISQYTTWQTCPVILNFDEMLTDMISKSSSSQNMPCEMLTRIPYWAVCVAVPGQVLNECHINYLMLSLNYDEYKPGQEKTGGFLSILITPYAETERAWGNMSYSYNLDNSTIDAEISERINRSQAHKDVVSEEIQKLYLDSAKHIMKLGVNIGLYLTCEKPDYESLDSIHRYGKSVLTITKSAEKSPHEYLVGKIVSSALRLNTREYCPVFNDSGGRSVSPHWRRSHFHRYRTGKGRKECISHWLPPIPVALAKGDQLPVIEKDLGLSHITSNELEDPVIDKSFFMPTDGEIH